LLAEEAARGCRNFRPADRFGDVDHVVAALWGVAG
jgi:hypothetical protein